jgi:gamma-glutamylcyclotransferase (GGCT)/AIG2-like uncharacterized protein YtfP
MPSSWNSPDARARGGYHPGMTLHFAYGSNMNRAGMARRCPGAVALGRAVLDDHRFVITSDGYASVQRVRGERVHGVLWRLGARDLAALDAYEDVGGGLYTRAMIPVLSGGHGVKALIYLGRSREAGRPEPGYLDNVVAAAREWQLPWDYIQGLTRWADDRARAARAGESR